MSKTVWILALTASLFSSAAGQQNFIAVNFHKAYQQHTRSLDGSPGKNYWQNGGKYAIKVSFDPITRELYYRGQGVFDLLYAHHRQLFARQYDFVITEIATRNQRSQRAHERVGFETINTYRDELDEWNVVVMDL